jgi:hypothetical protein
VAAVEVDEVVVVVEGEEVGGEGLVVAEGADLVYVEEELVDGEALVVDEAGVVLEEGAVVVEASEDVVEVVSADDKLKLKKYFCMKKDQKIINCLHQSANRFGKNITIFQAIHAVKKIIVLCN